MLSEHYNIFSIGKLNFLTTKGICLPPDYNYTYLIFSNKMCGYLPIYIFSMQLCYISMFSIINNGAIKVDVTAMEILSTERRVSKHF